MLNTLSTESLPKQNRLTSHKINSFLMLLSNIISLKTRDSLQTRNIFYSL